MTDFVDNPFQMDEDIPNSSSTCKVDIGNHGNSEISSDIHLKLAPRYCETQHKIIYENEKVIRSKVQQLKLDDIGTDNPSTEDDPTYEEDIDDKFDYNLQNKISQDYESTKHIEKPLTPPENFAPVINKIYRSSFPQPQNFTFLKKLKLKSILCLIPEEYPSLQLQFLKDENIKLFQLGMSGNKEPFVEISSELITEAIKIVLNPENQPILIHCNRGKHRTGCLVGVIRRLQEWSLTIIFDEYRKFAAPKERPMDQQFIELYDERAIIKYCEEKLLLPLLWE